MSKYYSFQFENNIYLKPSPPPAYGAISFRELDNIGLRL